MNAYVIAFLFGFGTGILFTVIAFLIGDRRYQHEELDEGPGS
jgi:hypothetical protein